MFNIRIYSPEVSNIRERKAELNIVFPRLNNLLNKKQHETFPLLCTPSTKQNRVNARKALQILVTTQLSVFFFLKKKKIQLQLRQLQHMGTIILDYLNYSTILNYFLI